MKSEDHESRKLFKCVHLLQELSCPQVHLFMWCEPSLAPLYRLSRVEQEAGRLDEGEHGGGYMPSFLHLLPDVQLGIVGVARLTTTIVCGDTPPVSLV